MLTAIPPIFGRICTCALLSFAVVPLPGLAQQAPQPLVVQSEMPEPGVPASNADTAPRLPAQPEQALQQTQAMPAETPRA